MKRHYSLSDQEFEERFENATLGEVRFDHEAHLRLAWIHLVKYGLTKAEENMNLQLEYYVSTLGAEDKYNRTITTAAVKAVDHFWRRTKGSGFEEMIEEFPRLKFNFKELMSAHYSFDIFNSSEAKKDYLLPDLAPFN